MNIPAKEWNAEKGKMEDTSLPHWQEYFAKREAFENDMYAKEPKKEQFGYENGWHRLEDERAFDKAYSEWHRALYMDRPNKPGYYRAAND